MESHHLLLLVAFSSHCLLNINTTSATTNFLAKAHRIIFKLSHHKFILNQLHNQTVKASLARLAYLERKAGGISHNYYTNDLRARMKAEIFGVQFMANFSIGDPPVPQLLTMDTGSNLFWVQCLPCNKCFQQTSPLFDPFKSSTYTNISCKCPSCSVFDEDKCDAYDNCKFSHKYLDGTDVAGILGTEALTFVTSDEDVITVPEVLFGCASDNNAFDGEPSGIIGLGPSNISLVTQLGSKFSYCLGSIMDPKYTHNVLVLGEGARLEGDSTPLEVFNDLYHVRLESISVGEKQLDIDPCIFKRTPEGKGGVVIDSGTTLTFLLPEWYEPVASEVQKLLDGKLERSYDPYIPNLCYKGVISRDLTGFPVVTFHFAGGAELALDINSLFQENGKEEFCLALQESQEMSIIGIMAQQNYNVGFDVSGKNVFFQRIDCQLLH
ncbi:aspartyl protease UND-like [Neltuma alba]|uniref:aspartyl protease UND-like n=1 Tax=Neltuma alba TaxID=207710 RepID=UPI0010A381B2|nr:aspartyl protease UND-like [Prosopis alba]